MMFEQYWNNAGLPMLVLMTLEQHWKKMDLCWNRP